MVESDSQHTTNTKHQILENARELFAEHGYDGTSIRQLTASLNITPAALYYHFASKNDVLEGLAATLHDSSDALLEASQCCWNLGCQLMNEAAAALHFGAIAEEAEDPLLEVRRDHASALREPLTKVAGKLLG